MSTVPDLDALQSLEGLERYWTETLVPLVPTPGPPPDYARPPVPTDSATIDVDLQLAVSAAVVARCQAKPSLLCAMVLTACQALLYRHNGDDQVCVLTPVSQEVSGEAGTNRWLVIKSAVDSADTLTTLLERVRDRLADAYAHQEFPFARVLDLLGRSWPANRAPLSDVAVAVVGVSRMDVLTDMAMDLAVLADIHDRRLRLRLMYRPDLFASETIVQLGRQLVWILNAMVEAPYVPLRDASLADPEAPPAYAPGGEWESRALPAVRIETLVARMAEATPAATAFIADRETLSYGDLVRQARQLACELRRLGIRSGDRVAIALDPGLSLPVALLGVLFSGAAFVPFDPRHTTARLQQIVAVAGVRLVIAEERLSAAFEDQVRVLTWNQALAGDVPDVGDQLETGDADAVAYVMFTSGSTGTAKGVAVSHRAFVNYLLWAKDYYLGDERPTFSWCTSIAFDLTLTTVFVPLIAGASAVIVSSESVIDMNGIFADPRIGVVKATPSHLKLLRLADLNRSAVTRVIVGGEAFDAQFAAALQRALGPSCAIFNEYGPTEATIGCMAHRLTDDDRIGGTVPLGRPIWNTRIYLLDDERRPVPIGMPGQIWIAGAGLANGYVNAPEQTRDHFVDDVSGAGQMYATGDRARADARGRLYWLGRRDDQVKFKGVRVELGDVRAAMTSLPRVRDAVVRVVEDERRNQIMIAYYVARQTLDVSILRAGLLERLPVEVMPNLFVRVPKLPLTLNGKVDADRLPALEEIRRSAPQVFEAPRTKTERVVADIWSDVVGVREVSVHSNFFELGGHSLLASQVVARLAERLGIEIPLRSVFESPTIAQLATIIDERLALS